MYILRALVHSMSRKKVSLLLVWLQFSLIFFIAFSLVCSCINLFKNENEKRRYIKADFDKCCQMIINTVNTSKEICMDGADFLSEVKSMDEVSVLGNYFYYSTAFTSLRDNKAFVEAVEKAVDEEIRNLTKSGLRVDEGSYQDNKKDLIAQILSVDYELFDSLLPNTFLEGGMPDGSFSESDSFKPVILGYGYKDAFDIGDTFISDDEKFKCRVVGILDKGSKWFSENYGLSYDMVNIDNSIIVLTDRPDTYIGTTIEGTVLANNYLISKEPFDRELEAKIGEVAKKYGISVGIYTFNEFFANTRENFIEQYYLTLFSILFLSVIAVFGLSSLIVYGINISKREIGIRMACGAETKHIMGIFCSEIFIIIILAFFTSCIMANSERLINFLMISMKDINIWVYAAVLAISLVVCIVSCIFPIRRIAKLEPRELTGGQ